MTYVNSASSRVFARPPLSDKADAPGRPRKTAIIA
jgi:hypothetical protein